MPSTDSHFYKWVGRLDEEINFTVKPVLRGHPGERKKWPL